MLALPQAAKKSLERQIQSLQASVRKLEATLKRERDQSPSPASSGPGTPSRIGSGSRRRPVMKWVQKMAEQTFEATQPQSFKPSSPLKASMSTARNSITASTVAQNDKDHRKLTKCTPHFSCCTENSLQNSSVRNPLNTLWTWLIIQPTALVSQDAVTKRTCRALNHLGEERRKNQILEKENQVLEAKNSVLEARLEELQAQLVELDRKTAGMAPPSHPNAATNNVNNSPSESGPPPQRGWNLFGLWGAQAAAAEPELVPVPKPQTPEIPEIRKEMLQQEMDEWHDMVAELSETKLELAEVQGKLATALREASRLRDVNSALNAHIDKITEQGFTPLGSDLMTISTVASGR